MEKTVEYKIVEDEIVATLKELLKIDTRNIIRSDITAIKYISEKLNTFNIVNYIYEPYPGKGNLVGVIKGVSEENIVLYSHIDVDGFIESDWKYHPLSATEIDNNIYGRGALDCKGILAVWINIVKKISLENKKPEKTLLIVVTCDEEIQGDMGLKWLLNNTNHFKNTVLVISEGGGYPLKFKDNIYYTCQTGERRKTCVTERGNQKKSNFLTEYRNLLIGYLRCYYNFNTINYAIKSKKCMLNIRKISWETITNSSLKEDSNNNSYKLPFLNKKRNQLNTTMSITKYLKVINCELRKINTDFKLMTYISPGLSDNTSFSNVGIATLGFFPIDINNKISGIHGLDEYISRDSIFTSYNILSNIINEIIY